MLHPPGFYFVKKPKRFVILSSDKSSERNLSSFFDIKKPRRIEHLQSEEPFSSDPYFRLNINMHPLIQHIITLFLKGSYKNRSWTQNKPPRLHVFLFPALLLFLTFFKLLILPFSNWVFNFCNLFASRGHFSLVLFTLYVT